MKSNDPWPPDLETLFLTLKDIQRMLGSFGGGDRDCPGGEYRVDAEAHVHKTVNELEIVNLSLIALFLKHYASIVCVLPPQLCDDMN